MTQLTYSHEHGTRTRHFTISSAEEGIDSEVGHLPPLHPQHACLTYHDIEQGTRWELSHIRLRGPRSFDGAAPSPNVPLGEQAYFVGPGDHFAETAPPWVRDLAARHRYLGAAHDTGD